MRVAMWSGPRNLSTAMMYAFGNRRDFAVVDEPFYASYLQITGFEHPLRDRVIASQPTDPKEVARTLSGAIPGEKAHFYQKHMTQHMLPEMPRDWMKDVRHVFLIRHPARVLASFASKYEHASLDDIGFVQQTELLEAAQALGASPLVIDSEDIRRAPEDTLRKLCDALGLTWDESMLQWPKGGHPADGAWAAHWYGAVHRSTGFAGPEGPLPKVDGAHAQIVAQALPHYERMRSIRLR